jgi:hypothetical protein
VEIFTDRQECGARAIARLRRRLTGAWEFIAKGEGSEDCYHQWDCAFHLGRSEDRSVYALQLTDYGDPDNADPSRPRTGAKKVVAACQDPGTDDEGIIVRQLLTAYREQGGKYIEGYHRVGRFDLGDL